MTVYNVKTKEDYDSLMLNLKDKDYWWNGGTKLESLNVFTDNGETCIETHADKTITWATIDYFQQQEPNEEIIEFKRNNRLTD